MAICDWRIGLDQKKKEVLVESAKESALLIIPVVICLILLKLIFDLGSWQGVFSLLICTPFLFLWNYNDNKKQKSFKRQMLEWFILVGVVGAVALGIYLYLS